MIENWRSYSVEDFIPFTPEVYFRLTERINEAQWPLHLLMLAGGIAVVVLLTTKHNRMARISVALLGVAWIWTGFTFLIQRYAALNWAGEYFGWAFCLQGLFLPVCVLVGRFQCGGMAAFPGPRWLGLGLAGYGLLVHPLLALQSGDGWLQSEVFGIHPDPTAMVTLGILLLATRGWSLWLGSLVSLVWCAISALTLWALEADGTAVPVLAALLALVGMIWKTLQPADNTG